MHPVDVLVIRQLGVEEVYVFNIFETFFDQLVLGVEESLFPFRMGRADAPVECREENKTGGVRCPWHELRHGVYPTVVQGRAGSGP